MVGEELRGGIYDRGWLPRVLMTFEEPEATENVSLEGNYLNIEISMNDHNQIQSCRCLNRPVASVRPVKCQRIR